MVPFLPFLWLLGLRTHVWSRIRTLNLKSLYGEWVVISGATDGIGLEYAKEFARRGHSVILLGRSESKLSQAKQQVTRYTSPSKVVTIQVDFNEADSQVSLVTFLIFFVEMVFALVM